MATEDAIARDPLKQALRRARQEPEASTTTNKKGSVTGIEKIDFGDDRGKFRVTVKTGERRPKRPSGMEGAEPIEPHDITESVTVDAGMAKELAVGDAVSMSATYAKG